MIDTKQQRQTKRLLLLGVPELLRVNEQYYVRNKQVFCCFVLFVVVFIVIVIRLFNFTK